MKNAFLRSIICLLIITAGCSVQPPARQRIYREPTIRVGLVWGIDTIQFSMLNASQITSYDGSFIARGVEGTRWQAEVKGSKPGNTVYVLVAASMSSMARAQARARELEQSGFKSFIQPVGQELRIGESIVNDNRTFRVCLQKIFEDEESANRYRDMISNRVYTFVAQQKLKNAEGTILLKNLENGQEFESSKPILIRDTSVTLHDIAVGAGFHWERTETRTYPEIICFHVDNDGKLAVINILPIEKYLQGVVPSEMPEGFPLEALKAQAVAARGEVLSKLGLAHRTDPFDVCADVHCQVYSGLTKRATSTDQAVRETAGFILWKDEKICSAVYLAVCGGHGEDVENAWGGESQSFLKGEYDGPSRLERYGALLEEDNVRRWINDRPPAYCNTTDIPVPLALEYTKKYFRWEVRYGQEELKSIIKEKTGRTVGKILDLVPLARGVSGRIIKLRVLGENSDFIIQGELDIRKALSSNTLWSACFYTVKKGNKSGAPEEFILKGAGWGHGVGMCQTGAAVMALHGHRFDEILKHYYHGVQIRRLY